jgi:hypothetical protein
MSTKNKYYVNISILTMPYIISIRIKRTKEKRDWDNVREVLEKALENDE